jgi:hypothetical protein
MMPAFHLPLCAVTPLGRVEVEVLLVPLEVGSRRSLVEALLDKATTVEQEELVPFEGRRVLALALALALELALALALELALELALAPFFAATRTTFEWSFEF